MFIALSVSQEVIRALRPIVDRLRTRNPKSAAQLVDAACGAVRSLGEGSKRVGRDRPHLYRVADGSAFEARLELGNAEALGYLDGLELAPVKALLDRQAALLYRLLHPRT